MTRYRTLRVERDGPAVARISFDRPERRNALNTKMARELLGLFTDALAGDDALRVVVLTGSGDRAFCAGADLKERDGMAEADWRAQHRLFRRLMAEIADFPWPIIAAVNGDAVGGGCELAMAADFIYAADGARFGLPEVGLGIMPGGGGTQRLPRLVGEARAKELILTGRLFSAAEALEWGLVNAVVPAADLAAAVAAVAAAIASNAPLSIRNAKRAIHQGLQADLTTGLSFELALHRQLSASDDRHEGIAAFNERRPPKWTGA